jgi:signal peptidase
LATETLKKIWKNEYFQTAIVIALEFIIVFGLYFSAQIILGTEYPALAVASGSMLPTLNIGDLIIVQKVNPAEIHANYLTGDILVFRDPNNPTDLIVHRAVDVTNKNGESCLITTHGDNNPYPSVERFDSSYLVGKVMARIPYIGNIPLFFHSERNMYILILIIVVILAVLMFPLGFGGEEKPLKEEKKFWKVNSRLVYFFSVNFLIIGLLIFSLWGEFTFWQPGASPPRATIFGMYKDLEFHESFSSNAYIFQGFMTYRIECKVNSGTRVGVPTFSWFQFSLLILVLYNSWKIFDFMKTWKYGKQTEKV